MEYLNFDIFFTKLFNIIINIHHDRSNINRFKLLNHFINEEFDFVKKKWNFQILLGEVKTHEIYD